MPDEPQPAVRVPEGFELEYPDGRALATECVLNFGLVSGAAHSSLRRLLEGHGLPSMAAFNVLAILEGASSPLAPSVIASRMVVTRATMTGVLDSLERRHLLRRLPDPADARRRLAAITPAGRRLVRRVLPAVHRWEADLMACLSPDQQRDLLRALAALQERLRTIEPPADLGVPDQVEQGPNPNPQP